MKNLKIKLACSVIFLMSGFITTNAATIKPQDSSFNFEQASISSIQNQIKNHELTCLSIINAYLLRIKQYNLSVDENAPINAFTEITPSLIEQAKYLDKFFMQNKQVTGPLHCVPIVVKDNIDTMDSTTTTGSFSMLGSQPLKDAFIVKKLRDAGAVIIGKGAMDEFAWGMFGISSRNGRIGNVFDTDKNPGGSSGGSAAAVSAGFAVVGIGTDNSGSVRIPAAFHGLVGLRPSTGLISQSGIFPMGNLDGTAGPITKNTEDLAILLDVIAKPDDNDLKTQQIKRPNSYTSYLREDGIKNKRIGIVRSINQIKPFHDMPKSIEASIQSSIKKMNVLGTEFIDISLPDFDNDRAHNQAGEIQDINTYLNSFPSTRRSFEDICYSGRTKTFGNQKSCIKFMKQINSKSKQSTDKALSVFKKNKAYLHQIMNKYQLDALLIPITTTGTATYDASNILTWRAPLSSNSGLPAISMTIGYNKDNLPVAVELLSRQNHEHQLIEISYAFEKNTPKRYYPQMPKPNKQLLNLSIAELNNLFTLIGVNTFNEVLKNLDDSTAVEDALSAKVFREIVVKTISKNIPKEKI